MSVCGKIESVICNEFKIELSFLFYTSSQCLQNASLRVQICKMTFPFNLIILKNGQHFLCRAHLHQFRKAIFFKGKI